jgi:hypothetical protein
MYLPGILTYSVRTDVSHTDSATACSAVTFDTELFGVFGNQSAFAALRSPDAFDRVVAADALTVGVSDDALGVPGRTSVHADAGDCCVVWGEAFPPGARTPRADTAAWLLERYRAVGDAAFDGFNGSYVAALATDGDALVATDPIRSWECYYTDAAGERAFGTDWSALARLVEEPTLAPDSVLELIHLGFVLEPATVLEEIRRTPFDGWLGRDAAGGFDRFVYEPREFDYAAELADRLGRAIDRRAGFPGRSGLLLSAGYDSRVVLSRLVDFDACYTISDGENGEVAVSRRLAAQYGATHETLLADDRYLNTEPSTVRYGQGTRESIHVHQGGIDEPIDVETVYHGLLFDTLLRGYLLPRARLSVAGHSLPLGRLDPDPDVERRLAERVGYRPAADWVFPGRAGESDAGAFLETRLRGRLRGLDDRYDSIHNGADLLGIETLPPLPFRWHLADQYTESFVAVDAEILDWHLATPPRHRTTETFLDALRRLDPDALAHRPPDRPRDSDRLNAIEGFLRRSLPFLDAVDDPWPDRQALYDRADLDERLFPHDERLRTLPTQVKLRINDLRTSLRLATDGAYAVPPALRPLPYL